ncbi:hypothetical protein BGW42_001047 [Actinomortierella wolfii]|nr:hypothetical protein BGW42_001047 [Actinomortierella wolfii]
MSRRDIIILLERLSLDHRASLAEKACAYLLSVESNRAIKSHTSHAAICVDIAAEQLDIEISRQALVRMSGAPSPVVYNSTLQIIRRHLLGDRASSSASSHHGRSSSSGSALATAGTAGTGVSSNQAIVDLITMDNFSILKQLAIKRGSMELEGLVLECLSQFFDKWVTSLTPAQRVHVDYADLKWVGAAFWLCSMARQRQVKAPAPASAESAAETSLDGSKPKAASTAAPKRLGGKGAKELKEMVLDMLQHRVTAKEFDKTIRLMEDTVNDYLLSLGVQKKAASSGGTKRSATTTGGRKRKTTDQSAQESTPPSTAVSSDAETAPDSTMKTLTSDSRRVPTAPSSSLAVPARRAAAKRTISNISEVSLEGVAAASPLESGAEDTAPQEMAASGMSMAQKPSAKRAKMEGDRAPRSRAPLSSTRSALMGTITASTPLSIPRRRTGNVYAMIPRVKYQQTKAYQHYVEWRKQVLEKLSVK